MLNAGQDSPKKWASLIALVSFQVPLGVIYKLSQRSQASYAYSTFSALAMAEAIKFGISASLFYLDERRRNASYIPVTKQTKTRPLIKIESCLKIVVLASMYCANNQLTFSLFLRADPATINIFKSASTLITAALACALLGRHVSWPQWAAIILQVSGLFVTQFDACKEQMVLPMATYSMLLISVTITALSGVWNEHQLKTLPFTLHQQNMVLYACGFVFNTSGHIIKSRFSQDVPSFFKGYDAASVGVVVVNGCFGVVVTAVYRYADAIMKCLANAVTTVLLIGLSWHLFGLKVHAAMLAGCVTVVAAVALYSTAPTSADMVASMRSRQVVGACMLSAIAGLYFATQPI